MIGVDRPITIDTNIAVYALGTNEKNDVAAAALRASAFISVQVLNEFANVALRKRHDDWTVIAGDVAAIRAVVPLIRSIDEAAHHDARRICERYQSSFYDALMLAVALAGGARTIYSEDMHHGLVVDGALRIVDPFRD